jgi:parallel beta-helix repeat protein
MNINGNIQGRKAKSGIPRPDIFDLKGDIIEDGGSYYLKDSSGNERNFLITGYDWSDRTVTGFPYKTAATISAPVGDAELIAEDINNFLYDSEGTPNQIPVVSLFQDIDYEHKIFCKHSGQVLDVITGVEMQEPSVSRISMYSTALEGKDLEKVQVYFVVPTEDVNAIWVGKTTVGVRDGSKLNPYETLTAAEAAASNGDTVYVKTGTYKETNFFYPRKQVDWCALGLTTIQSTGTSFVILSELPTGNKMKSFIIDAETNTSLCVYSYYDSIYENIYIKNTKTGNSFIENQTGSPTYTNCVLKPTESTANISVKNSITFDSCYINSIIKITAASDEIDFNHNLILADISTSTNYISISATNNVVGFFDNTIIVNDCYNFMSCNFAASTTDLSFISNKITINSPSIGFVQLINAGFDKIIFHDNLITNNSEKDIFINSSSTSNLVAYNNYILCNEIASGIKWTKEATGETTVEIYNNRIELKKDSPYGVCVGNENSNANDDSITSIDIYNNIILGAVYYGETESIATHGIFIGFQSGVNVIKNNQVQGCHFAAALKGYLDYSNSDIKYNIFANNQHFGIVLAGAKNANIIGNTLVNNAEEFCIYALTAGNGAIGNVIKNNIISNNAGTIYRFDSDSYTDFGAINNNLLFGYTNVAYDGSANVLLATWQGLGLDTNSIFADPELTDFIPDTAITGAADLGEDYETGLDASTDWSGDLPDVVTRNQGTNWDVGAYINSLT